MIGPRLQPITPQQQRFVDEYLIDPDNAAAAAKRAGYSIKNAASLACNLLKHPGVAKAVKEAMGQRAKRLGITQDRVLQELALIGFAKLSDAVTMHEDGDASVDMKGLSESNKQPAEVIVTITKGKNAGKSVIVKSVKLADKVSALEKIGKHLGMFKEQVEHSGKLTLEQLVRSSYEDKVLEKPELEVNETDAT